MKNYYPGINPHLNSHLQSVGGRWQSFHMSFLVKLTDTLNTVLPDQYYVYPEDSLQISISDPIIGTELDLITTYPDALIRQTELSASRNLQITRLPTKTFPIMTSTEPEPALTAVVIYKALPDQTAGEPITRIELLSPTNKTTHLHKYLHNRDVWLETGLRLVELDWLHETPPILKQIPNYKAREMDSYPYNLFISDPRPTIWQDSTKLYSFRVQEAIPIIPIPLAEMDYIEIDLNPIYNQTLNLMRGYHLIVNYHIVPERFETYDEQDQAYIQQKMREIAATHLNQDH